MQVKEQKTNSPESNENLYFFSFEKFSPEITFFFEACEMCKIERTYFATTPKELLFTVRGSQYHANIIQMHIRVQTKFLKESK